MNPPTRLGFFAASWVLWATAGLWRAVRAGERLIPAGESWGTLAVCYLVLGAYVWWRVGIMVVDSQWLWGWRR